MAIKTVEAPIPGTFYRGPAPEQPPFKGRATMLRLATRSD